MCEMELRLAASQSAADVERALAGAALTAELLALVPESVDAAGLARVAVRAGLLGAEGADRACVQRAAAIDRRTGRADWAAAWLAGVAPHSAAARRALGCARVVDQLVRAGDAGCALADVVDMAPHELAGWLAGRAGEIELPDGLGLDQAGADQAAADHSGGGLAAAWDAWWTDHMLDAPAGLLARLAAARPAWFGAHVVLGAALAAGGPCSGADATAAVLGVIVGEAEAEADAAMPDCVAALVGRGLAAPALARALRRLAARELAAAAGAGLRLARARLLARAARGAAAAGDPAAALEELRALGGSAFAALGRGAVDREWLAALLRGGRADAAARLLAGDARLARSAAACDAVCAAARELFDNARDCGDAARAVQRCAGAAPQTHGDARVRRELLLADAALLVRALGPPGALPLELRLAPDAYALVRLVLARHPAAVRRQRLVRQIAAARLRMDAPDPADPADPADPPDPPDLAVRSPHDAMVLALMLDAAAGTDADAAHRIVRQLAAARALLRRPGLGDADDGPLDAAAPLAARAADCAWRACAAFAAATTDSDARRDSLALALSLCPASAIPGLLDQWRAAEKDAPPAAEIDAPPAAELVRAALLGRPAADDVSAAADEPAGDVRSFDPAVVRRCLRAAPAAHVPALLGEWLGFALTAARGPTTDAARAFCARMEDEIAARHAAAACDALAARVLPRLRPTQHAQLARAYDFYARCLADPADRRQAELRAQLVRALPAELAAAPLDRLAALATAADPRAACDALAVDGLVTDASVHALVALAPRLAALRPLPAAPEPDPAPEPALAPALASAVCAWQLGRVLGRRDGAELFGDLLADWAPRLEPPDLAALATRIAFGPQQALRSAAAAREAVDLCAALAGDARADVRRARAAAAFAAELDAQRDPFDYAPLPAEWARRQRGSVVAADDEPAAVARRLAAVLAEMAAAALPAYFVCQSYACAAELLAAWGGAMPRLAAVYADALAAAIAARAADPLAPCAAALELCSFDYGDCALTDVLRAFRRELPALLAAAARRGRFPGGPAIDPALRLSMLRAADGHGAAAADGDPDGESDGDAGGDSDADLALRLAAEEHWGAPVPPGQARAAVWAQLLGATTAVRADEQVPALAALLAEWPGGAPPAHWALLLRWVVDARCARLAPRVLARLPADAAAVREAGERAFGPLLAAAPRCPESVCALATLALLFPDPLWAEPAMGLVAHVVAAAPSSDRPPPHGSDDDDQDGWDIDDALDAPRDPPSPPSAADPTPAQLAAARDAIMDSALLHLGIARRGYVPACAASPALVHRVCATLLAAPASGDVQMLLADVPGGAGALFCRTAAALCSIGMEHVAMPWVYEFLDVPHAYRFAVQGAAAEVWLHHLASVAGPPAETTTTSAAASEKQQQQQQQPPPMSCIPEVPRLPADSDDAPPSDDGWGGDDDDFDLDADLENL
ncbi:hypothetical protein H4R18_002409 [Coemansia javaensis]|uniref:Uncharacterized protein n=1 Tax=Coemansia javaensis TaxID=2761396 RepID=A0A9W8LHR5_9FUNG|nr:hypothetical protein H4R18_002409 [Coemansia javaensis]